MDKKQLSDRLRFHEWDDFEVKEARRAVPKDIWKTVGAFSNMEGGIIVLGIKEIEDGTFQISGVENIEKIQNDFISTLRGEKFNIPLSTKGHIFDFDGKKVLLFKIHAMPITCKPIYYGGDIRNTYIRQGSGDHRCSKEEINRMLRQASEHSSDSMMLKGFTIDDIDSETVTIYKGYLKYKDPESPFLVMDEKAFLRKLGCLTTNKERDNQEELTMAGLLLFGKDDSIRERFPAYELDVYLVPRDDRVAQGVRWNDRKIYECNLVKTYLEAIEYIKGKIEIPFALADDHMTRTEEVPVVLALREALVNMIIHRDYFEHGQSRVKIYRDRIEMVNPGSTPRTVQEIIEDEVTEPRNPIMAKLFRMIGWAEVAGSGMMKILKNWKAAGYVEPRIENNVQGYYFKMIFPFEEMNGQYRIGKKSIIKESPYEGHLVTERSLYDYVNESEDDIKSDTDAGDAPIKLTTVQKKIVLAMVEKEEIKVDEIAEMLGKSIPTVKRHIGELKKLNILERIGGKKKGAWRIKIYLKDCDTLNVPKKLAPQKEKIVALIKDKRDLTIDEIAELMGKSIPTIKRYIDELKKLNVLERIGGKKKGAWRIKIHLKDHAPENDTLNDT
ncbi:MAG: winged helix-turn-helix transcriptional regulator [Candidatus Aminicenantes bacterium]|nr:winged helix-turn-helix transcriptional regulator [Candidatus Aminicenantes bacterium]NIM81203.1 winged helix-turn-helix transcriptional regulator [Candidatus Aminicenantes bacterium]NIN20578.1 winged helix-turn-helix transcriptional regulator [Candidatus Aminicenantes bacterium]NIN44357.1 winged helix-turn-helix transcriptional regulator [Candidatus Aminicenantes bacterium]NIN87176.1 winged helix-turn-helix transcriptional regulator [Candidatus Aminicenantes bacterium]